MSGSDWIVVKSVNGSRPLRGNLMGDFCFLAPVIADAVPGVRSVYPLEAGGNRNDVGEFLRKGLFFVFFL